jgi:ankyrin repeat protein
LETAKALLAAGADPTVKSEEGRTPLIMAAFDGRTEVVTNLIQWGAGVNVKDKNGWTALMCASWRGHLETAKTLLAAGADPSMKSEDGKTALTLATQVKNPDLISLLEKRLGLTQTP